MEFEEKYKFQNCNIEFNKKTYIRHFSNGNKIKGEIFENNFEYVLKEKTTSLQIHILKEDLNKDTVFFITKDINDKVKENELELYSGKLIIIK
ncbi:hypothetical protein OX284_012125 [Flavobacterium sp. SUN046]|uniref:hypothetical protein n=1 Tax=Flavobacterium sp. SUN046 TaxID=3002440 RepID=UPI002DB66E27|nr:hypothetical protein [Flavobacterium sp. SUN046]MEC4050181.1 hypothetical protein [Flavobacterium sp. SUN046]